MKTKFFFLSMVAATLLSSCLSTLHNLVNYKNVISDNRITGNWQYNGLSVTIEPIPTSSFFKDINASSVVGEMKIEESNGEAVSVNANVKKSSFDRPPVSFRGEVTHSKDSNKISVNGQVKSSAYDSYEDSMLYSKSYVINFTRSNFHFYMACCLTRIGDDLYADLEPLTAEPINNPAANDINDLFNAGSYLPSHSIAKVIIHNEEIEFSILNGDFIKTQLTSGFAAIKYEADALFGTTVVTASAAELRQFLSKYGNDERLYSAKNTVILKKIVP